MKIRKDFVTNSSSSSFICEICGRTESGYDLDYRDIEMCECVNGHIFCTDHMLPHPSREEIIKEILSYEFNDKSSDELESMDSDELFDIYWDVPELVCPICQFIEYSEDDLAAYLLKEYEIPREEVFAEIKKFNKRRKKLYDSEYIAHVCQKHNLNPAEIVAGWKEKFGSYHNFKNYLRG